MRAFTVLILAGLAAACATGAQVGPPSAEEIDLILNCDRLDDGVDCGCVRETAIAMAGTEEGAAAMSRAPRVMSETSQFRQAAGELQRSFAIGALINAATDMCASDQGVSGADL
jgi:hypothetical protein